MVGLGETDDEVIASAARPAPASGGHRDHRSIPLTRPQAPGGGPFRHAGAVQHYRHVGEEELGFLQVVSTPLTRSSYHAGEVQRLMASHPR